MAVEPVAPSCGFLSTYPPTQCGLASFTASLRTALVRIVGASGEDERGHGVVRAVDRAEPWTSAPEVIHHHQRNSLESLEARSTRSTAMTW
jgi:hypothetical protein